jgi:hypothetical protein
MTEHMHHLWDGLRHLWDGSVLWLHIMWKWLLGGATAFTLTQVKEGLGVALTAVLIVVGVLNAIKIWREIRKSQ